MGAPLEDAPRLHHWSNWIQRQFDAGEHGERARADRAGGRGVLRVRRRRSCTRAARDPATISISKLIAAEEAGRAASRRRVHQPRLQRARRRRGHDPEPAGARDQAAGRTSRAVGALWRGRTLAAAGGRGGAAVRADHAVHGPDPDPEVTFRDVTFPAGTVVMVCAYTGNRDLDAGEPAADRERSTSPPTAAAAGR